MCGVNVVGRAQLLQIAMNSSIEHLCYSSSAGVIEKTHKKWVDEKTKC